jgi:hypothetical protein
MSTVLEPVDEVLYSHGNTLHPYPLAYQLCTVEDSIHKKNQLLDVSFSEDQGSFLIHISPVYIMLVPGVQVHISCSVMIISILLHMRVEYRFDTELNPIDKNL